MNIVSHEKNYNKKDNIIADIDSPDSFIAYFMELYNKNTPFNHFLLVGLLKDAVAKMSEMGNLRYAQNVVNFYSMLEATSRKRFEAVSAKLVGHCLQHM